MRWLSMVRPVFILSGSAGSPLGNLMLNKYDQIASDIAASWVGVSQDELLISLGLPLKIINLSNGTSMLFYLYSKTKYKYDLISRSYLQEYEVNYHEFIFVNGILAKWFSTVIQPKIRGCET